jgi:hypothetical protein
MANKVLDDIEKFIASEAGQAIKNCGKGVNGVYKITGGHVKFFKAGEKDSFNEHHLTTTEQNHLNNGGRLILVYGCGYRLPISV